MWNGLMLFFRISTSFSGVFFDLCQLTYNYSFYGLIFSNKYYAFDELHGSIMDGHFKHVLHLLCVIKVTKSAVDTIIIEIKKIEFYVYYKELFYSKCTCHKRKQ
ncbi:uncharacterized protein LOC142323634 isoform X2 [Lycorma delicatula]|uniref:uncharacterized protein LOC142323634 isoform X2 n=1 Tax=Lycorma delicatula TaxID=130591 RepID=UPI003F50DBC3